MQHWVALFTVTSWQEAISRNKIYVGFNKNQKNLALKIEKGDILIAYLTKVSKFVAVLRVIEEASLFFKGVHSIPEVLFGIGGLGERAFLQRSFLRETQPWECFGKISPSLEGTYF